MYQNVVSKVHKEFLGRKLDFSACSNLRYSQIIERDTQVERMLVRQYFMIIDVEAQASTINVGYVPQNLVGLPRTSFNPR